MVTQWLARTETGQHFAFRLPTVLPQFAYSRPRAEPGIWLYTDPFVPSLYAPTERSERKVFVYEVVVLPIEAPQEHFYDWVSYPKIGISSAEKTRWIAFWDLNGHIIALVRRDLPLILASDWVHSYQNREVAIMALQKILHHIGREDLLLEDEEAGGPALEEIVIGADPEFEILNEGQIISASRLVAFEGMIGHDGTGDQIELRPRPSRDPRRLYRNIRRLVQYFEDKNPGTCLLISGHAYPLGCHLHIGTTSRKWSIGNPDEVVEAIDCFPTPMGELGKVLLDLSGRARGGYARRRAWEGGKAHGGIEYRTPPSSILFSESLFTWVAGVVLHIATNNRFPSPRPEDFPTEEVRQLIEWARKGIRFSVGKRVEVSPGVVLREEDFFSETWHRVAQEYAPRPGAPQISLFGYRADRGLVTNLPQLAEEFNITYYPDDNFRGIGLPRLWRESNDESFIRRIIEVILRIYC